MDHKQGTDRNQVFMFCLESAIANDAFVRVVDAFVDVIDLKSFGFSIWHSNKQEAGGGGVNQHGSYMAAGGTATEV